MKGVMVCPSFYKLENTRFEASVLAVKAINFEKTTDDTMIARKHPARDKEGYIGSQYKKSKSTPALLISTSLGPLLMDVRLVFRTSEISMTEPLAKIGRGGAGNYWSTKDLDEAEKAGTHDKDIEAKTSNSIHLTLTRSTSQTPYSKIGRGGAGNVLYTPESEAANFELTRMATARNINETAAEKKKGPQVYHGYGGRGGTGNWRGNPQEERKESAREEESMRKEAERRAQDEVMGSLKAPKRVYRAPRAEEKARR